jgi:HSP20 family protein
MEEKELKVREKKEVGGPGERTRPGPVFSPSVDIYESIDALTLVADMPGVGKDTVEIHVEDDELTIRGVVIKEAVNERAVYTEYEVGDFIRTFSLSAVIDQSKIEAGMKNGVLTLTLPKVAAAKPRQIAVKGE